MRHAFPKQTLCLFLLLSSSLLSQSSPLLTFHVIGSPPNVAFPSATAVNIKNVVVGGYLPIGSAGYVGYLQSGSHFYAIAPQGSTSAYLMGINDSGLAVGGFCTDQSCGGSASEHGFTYNAVSKQFTTFDYPQAGTKISPSGINDAGQIVGGYCPNSVTCGLSQFGFLLSGGQYTTISVPGASFTQASGINNSGTVLGRYLNANFSAEIGFLWQNGTFLNTNIQFPGTNTTIPVGIDDAGNVYGAFYDSTGVTHGFQYSVAGVYTQIDVPSAVASYLAGASSNGNVVGGAVLIVKNQYYEDFFIGTPLAAKPEGK